MKTYPDLPTTGIRIILVTLFFWANSLHAQTFRGNKQLTEVPKSFGALIYPVKTRPQTIRINFDNPGRKMVRVVIQHENGRIVYDEYKNTVACREYVDLSALPAGNYVVDLSSRHDHITTPFTIEAPQTGQITMGDHASPIMAERPTRKRLVVKQ